MEDSRKYRIIAAIAVLLVLAASFSLHDTGQDQADRGTSIVTETVTVTVQAPRGDGGSGEETGQMRVENGVVRLTSWRQVDELISLSLEAGAGRPVATPLPAVEGPVMIEPLVDVAEAPGTRIGMPERVATPQGYTTTNVRVMGVDEPDLVKVNGTHAYIVTPGMLLLVKVVPASQMEVVYKVPVDSLAEAFSVDLLVAYNLSGRVVAVSMIPARLAIEGVYVSGGDAIVLIRESRAFMGVDRVIVAKYRPGAGVVSGAWITGSLVDSRMVNDTLVIVTMQPATEYARPIINGEVPQPGSIAVTGTPVSYTNILALDVATMDYRYTGLLGPAASIVYMTVEGSIYVAQSSGGWGRIVVPIMAGPFIGVDELGRILSGQPQKPMTTIARINVATGELEAYTAVEGWIGSTWAIDEYRGYLRLVVDSVASTNGSMTVSLYILNATSLEVVSTLDSIAFDEQVYGVRFMGDMVYFVTFRIVDPLFAVNLSDPRNPVIVGYLKAPGFDEYLHPLPGGLLLGLGYEQVGPYNSLRATLYNISGGAPEPVARLYIKGRYVYSPALDSFRGYRLIDFHRDGLVVIPVIIHNMTSTITGYLVIGVDVGKPSLSLRGIIGQEDAASLIRSFHVDDVIYTIAVYMSHGITPEGYWSANRTLKIGAYDIDTLDPIGVLEVSIG